MSWNMGQFALLPGGALNVLRYMHNAIPIRCASVATPTHRALGIIACQDSATAGQAAG